MAVLFYHFGVALAIGLLIGLERQFRTPDEIEEYLLGGIRTFPLMALTGCAGAMLADVMGTPWVLALPLLVAGALLMVAYVGTVDRGAFGMTTEIAALLTILIGALCYHGRLELAVALGVTTLTLLSLKLELHRFSRAFTRNDMVSLAQFGLMTAIVLPVLPDTPLGPAPFDSLTLRNIWLMVVLVAAIGMVGYFLQRIVGEGKAIVLTGFFAGLASSTAVTLTFSERSRVLPALSVTFAIAVVVAWSTMFLRVIVEVAVVNRALLSALWVPMTLAVVAGGAYCAFLGRKTSHDEEGGESDGQMDVKKPFSLKQSLSFGALYAVVLVVARLAQMTFGEEGIYVSAVAAGLTDVDAITLSMAKLSLEGGSVSEHVAVRAITLAAVSNTMVKMIIVMALAHAMLRKAVLPGFLLMVAAALGAAYLV